MNQFAQAELFQAGTASHIDTELSRVLFSSKETVYGTPQRLFTQLDREFRFELDVCATPENAKCPKYFTPEQDCLEQDWSPRTCWMNPPYGRDIKRFIAKAYYEAGKGATVVCLVPSRTDTKWWGVFYDHDTHQLRRTNDELRFIRGRLCFEGETDSAPFPSTIIVMRPEKL